MLVAVTGKSDKTFNTTNPFNAICPAINNAWHYSMFCFHPARPDKNAKSLVTQHASVYYKKGRKTNYLWRYRGIRAPSKNNQLIQKVNPS